MVAFGSRRLEISNMAHRFLCVAGYSIREIGIFRRFVSIDRKNLQKHLDGEYTNEPCYPPILDLSRQATKERVAKHRSDKIKQLSTVEEKLVELNAPKYYGWWSCCFQEKLIPYNALPFVQFATRTAVERGLPAVYDKLDEEARQATGEIQGQVSDLILQEFESVVPRTNRWGDRRSEATEEDRIARNVLPHINRLLATQLVKKNSGSHLSSVEVDLSPRVEAFWFLGGIEPDRLMKKSRKGYKMAEDRINEFIDRPMQYTGEPCLSLRHHYPLPQFVERDSGVSIYGNIPEWNADPRTLSYRYKSRHGTNVPGFWPGTAAQFGHLSMLLRGYMNVRDGMLGGRDHQEGLDVQGILHSFAWTMSQACYLGFGPYNELDFPLTSQTVISNGQYFSFYSYQLNTCSLDGIRSSDSNPRKNVCFATNEMKLFDVVENGQVKGFNEEVLNLLVKFYMMKPVERTDVQSSPELYNCNSSDSKLRQALDKKFKHLSANRPRHLLKDEMYHWEKIYKVDFKTRPMEARRRFFEVGTNPGNRRLDDHAEPYVPKALREVPKKSRRGRLPNVPTVKL